jgi:hypothetical protein
VVRLKNNEAFLKLILIKLFIEEKAGKFTLLGQYKEDQKSQHN